MKDILVPTLGESVTEAIVAKWLIHPGDFIQQDQLLVELETDKVTLEINAPISGILKEISYPQGTKVKIGDSLGKIEHQADNDQPSLSLQQVAVEPNKNATSKESTLSESLVDKSPPSVRNLMAEHNLKTDQISGTGKGGRLTKTDVLNFMQTSKESVSVRTTTPQKEERVPMSRLRQKIAERLKSAQQTAAILTTFNEIDMSNVMELRKRLQDAFQSTYGVKLGFMSFFVKACIQALQEIPALNAEIDGTDIIFKHFYDIGVAVSTDQGLVVPIVRNADSLNFGDIEKAIADLGTRAKAGKLELKELTGGTFTITNGGIFGSLMSTPILNPPQCGILGMHAIQNRPVAVGDKIEIRPMMYVALSYDHRLVDGKEAVTFLVRIKQLLEDPGRLLLQI